MELPKAWPATVTWLENFQFVGFDDQGHSLAMDVPPPNGSNAGFSPVRLLLISLAGCTAMDIALIMKKQRQTLTLLTVYVTGDQADEYPRYFKNIQIHYAIRGKDLKEEMVKKAIQLSDEKYCSVGATLKLNSKIETSYEILQD